MIEFNISDPREVLQSVVPAVQNFAVSFAYSRAVNALGRTYYQVPMTLRTSGGLELFLPVDPLVSVGVKYNVVKRPVQKQGTFSGTVKELWSRGDYNVSIAGILVASDSVSLQDFQKRLLEICNTPEAVTVECEMLNEVFQIEKIVIESLDFPFTKGENNQSFSIRAVSDESNSLFV